MGQRFLYYVSDKRFWQCLTSSHLLPLHLTLWERCGKQGRDKGLADLDKTLPGPRSVRQYRTVETAAATAARCSYQRCRLPGDTLHCAPLQRRGQNSGREGVKQGVSWLEQHKQLLRRQRQAESVGSPYLCSPTSGLPCPISCISQTAVEMVIFVEREITCSRFHGKYELHSENH